MPDFDLEPPHLTVAVYSDRDERETFAHLCSVLPQLDCSPTYEVEVAPAELDFELLSDLSRNRRIIKANPEQYTRLVESPDSNIRALRAKYSHRKYGDTVAEYELKTGPGSHPIGVSVSAGDLGFPDSSWSAKQRRAAYERAGWTISVLKSASSACKPLYGAIGVEYSLPIPGKLNGYRSGLPTEWFVSHVLLDFNPSLREKFRTMYVDGEVTDWDDGIFCSGWAPYNSGRRTLSQPEEVARNFASALERAVTEFRRYSDKS